jgi:hypothetical protein
MVMSPFRRQVRADTQRKGGKGGSKGAWYERFRLSGNATPFMLVRAEYTDRNPAPEEIEVDQATGRPVEVKKPYYKSRHHTVKGFNAGRETFATEVCSAGHDAHNPQPCVGCYAMDSGNKSCTVKDVHSFGLVHLIPYHRHPLIDRQTGGIKMKGDGTGPVMIDDECTGRTCNYCRVIAGQPPIVQPGVPAWPNFRPQDLQTVFGKRRYIEVGKNHLQDLMGWDSTVSSICANDGSQLITDGYKCPHCNSMVIDMSSDPRTDDQINDAVSRPYPCLQCRTQVFLTEVVSCDVCAAAQPPRAPAQVGIFDMVLWGKKEGENTNSHLVLQRHETLAQFEQVVMRGNANLFQGKTLAQTITDLAKPYNFDEVYTPKDLRGQSERLGLPIPPSVGGPSYGSPSGPQVQSPMAPNATAPAGYSQPMQPAAPAAPQPPAFQPPARGNFQR